jgi:cytochrome b
MPSSAQGADKPRQPVPVWDLPVRVFHWLLVVLILFSWYSGKAGGNLMQYHMWSGYAILTLVLFRILWGFVGSYYARFDNFLHGPARGWWYGMSLLRNSAPPYLGHNPLGGLMVVLLLLCLLIQAGTGLFSNDDIVTDGPLVKWISKDTSDLLSRVHWLNFNLLLGLAAVHILAVFYYLLVRKENLIGPMFTGVKQSAQQQTHAVQVTSTWVAVLLMAIIGLGVYVLVTWK